MLDLGASDSGSAHTLATGEELSVRLPENPTTGFRWQFDQTGTGQLRVVDDRFEPAGDTTPAAPGAAGVRVVRFIAERSGDIRLAAVNRRAWEQSASGARSVHFTIHVR